MNVDIETFFRYRYMKLDPITESEWLKKHMEACGLKQSRVAEKFGMPKSTVSMMMLTLNRLTPDAAQFIREQGDKYTKYDAYRISRLSSEDQGAWLAERRKWIK